MTNKEKFLTLKNELAENGYTVIEENWVNGYFIFPTGDDSICNFKVKELRGWLFGMWLEYGDDKKDAVFAQAINIIDKFKPSYSIYLWEGTISTVYDCMHIVQEVFDPLAYSYLLHWYREYTDSWPKHKLSPAITYLKWKFTAIYHNFIGEWVGVKHGGWVSRTINNSPYPFKCIVLRLKHGKGNLQWNMWKKE